MVDMKLSSILADITIIIICFILLELIIRISAPLVSGNVRQIYEIPDVASRLVEQESAILFLGNSLMGNALDVAEFDKQANLEVSSFKVIPDGTSLWDWSCIVKNNFIDKKRLPRAIIVGYAWRQAGPVPSRLGGFFCAAKDLPELIDLGMDNSSDVLEFLVAKASKLYAMRETIRKRMLDILIPDYRIYTQMINTERNKNRRVVDVEKKPEDFKLLSAYMNLLVSNNIKPVIIAMPVVQAYELDEGFFKTVKNSGGVVLDYRELEGIDDSMFRDSIHLNERGNKVFTHHLASDMKNILSRDGSFEQGR